MSETLDLNLVQAIAKELGDIWKVQENGMTFSLIRHPYEAILLSQHRDRLWCEVRTDTWYHVKRADIAITVTLQQSPEKIAHAITTRLLPDAKERWLELQQQRQRSQLISQRQAHIAQQLAAVACQPVEDATSNKFYWTFGDIWVDGYVGGTSEISEYLNLRLDRVPVALAETLMRVIHSYHANRS